jgi:HK97 family phage prohead protease
MSDMIKKTYTLIQKDFDKKERIFHGIMTTSTVDREKEVVITDGINTKSFEKIGAVFVNHDHSLPIGRPLELKKFPNRLEATVKIADRPTDFVGPFYPDTIWSLIEQDVIKGLSIGFMANEKRFPNKKDLEVYGDQVERIISKSELIELSVATIPCNEEAVIQYVSKGLIPTDFATKFFNINIDIPATQSIQININKKSMDRNRLIEIAVKKAKGELYL